MNDKVIGTVLGVVQACLWFMPLAHVNFIGTEGYQAGHHIGGIANLMLLAAIAYAILSWMALHVPRMIADAVVLAISLLFMVQAGDSAAWGLYWLVLTSIAGITLAVLDNKAAAKADLSVE